MRGTGHHAPLPTAAAAVASTAPRERLRIPRRIFAGSLTYPKVRTGPVGKERFIGFQKAAIARIQAAAERHVADIVRAAIELPDFRHKTLLATDFEAALRLHHGS